MFAKVTIPTQSMTLFIRRMRLPQRTRASRTDVLGIIPIREVECEQKDIGLRKKLRPQAHFRGLTPVQERMCPMPYGIDACAYTNKIARACRAARAALSLFLKIALAKPVLPVLYPGSRLGRCLWVLRRAGIGWWFWPVSAGSLAGFPAGQVNKKLIIEGW